ncbi:MAG: DUF5665 domain-containing protein [Patescibacteria group bacterium]
MTDEDIIKAIRDLTEQNKRLASLKWNFWRGIVYGFGFSIGSILLVALFLWVLSLFDTIPVIGRFISTIIETVKRGQ